MTPYQRGFEEKRARLTEALRHALARSPLTHLEVAEQAGISPSTLYRCLSEQSNPRLSSVIALEEALHTTLLETPYSVQQDIEAVGDSLVAYCRNRNLQLVFRVVGPGFIVGYTEPPLVENYMEM